MNDPFNCFRELCSPDLGAVTADSLVTIAVKDSIDVAGMQSLHGSALFTDAQPATRDAPAVARLRAAGAIIVGKTNMTELACSTDGRNQHFGNVANPLDPSRHPGGSSSGSAAAVASGMVDLALGSDTGGSIRVPAAACGIVGLKPTFGRIPTDGMSVCSTHLDHIGPMARTVGLVRWGLEVMEDPGWPLQSQNPSTLTVGVLQGPFLDRCSTDVLAAFEDSILALEAIGVTVRDIDLGIDLDGSTLVHATALSRDLFDRYGDRIAAAEPSQIGPELRAWADEYESIDDANYEAARREQQRLRSVVMAHMRAIDVLVTPTMREGVCLATEVLAQDRVVRTGNQEVFDMTGQPALTIPWGVDRNDLPLGLQLVGRMGEDGVVLGLGEALTAPT